MNNCMEISNERMNMVHRYQEIASTVIRAVHATSRSHLHNGRLAKSERYHLLNSEENIFHSNSDKRDKMCDWFVKFFFSYDSLLSAATE